MIYPDEFEQLLEDFKLLPGIGDKSAERFVYAIDSLDIDKVKKMSKDLLNYKEKIRKCNVCGHLTNNEICNICESNTRNKSIICVVEDSKSVFTFEKTATYNGLYHVLGGLISPIDEVNPEDLNINALIKNRINDSIDEVIIALNPTVEGEMTSLYIQKLLEKQKVKVSRLSYGIPMGSDLEYLDPITITRALSDRKFLS